MRKKQKKKGLKQSSLSREQEVSSRCTSKETVIPLVAATKQVSKLFAAKQHVSCPPKRLPKSDVSERKNPTGGT